VANSRIALSVSASPALPASGDGDHVVADSTQRFDDREREVLVGK
jgi:hypothetical protein